MRATLHVEMPEGTDPFMVHSTDSKRTRWRRLLRMLQALITGGGIAGRGVSRPTAWAGTAQASAIVTAAAVQAGDTVTLNGTALTATQHHSTGTVSITASGVDVNDTVTLGLAGETVDFTAKTAEDTAARQFDVSGTDAAAATSLAACINAEAARTTSDLYNLVTASAAAGVVTIRAVAAGTGGDSITLASSDAQLAVSGANLANGAAVGNNEFDYVGTNAQTATALAAAVDASSTALIGSALTATAFRGAIALSNVAAGQYVDIGPHRFTAVSTKASASEAFGEFDISSTDTNDATSLKNAINAHPGLKDKLVATSSGGTVTVRPIPPNPTSPTADVAFKLAKSGAGLTVTQMAASDTCFIVSREKGLGGNQATIATGSGVRLAITGSASRLAGGTRSTFTF